ncbi:MAG TPA: rhomboid family intramembrane serine protease [Usitatibacter sp.]|nr:rhomboid family intramembrane serine protease [Usitatibacter sp.]
MFPYRVDNPRVGPAFATATLIALNALVWVVAQGAGEERTLAASVCDFGLVPARLSGHLAAGSTIALGEGASCTVGSISPWITPLTSMFMHGSWFHILGNMWFLWLFGRNVEDAMGSVRFAYFYLLIGLVAAMGQALADPASALPMVGASGAISGVMGAYIVLFPQVRVHMWIFLGIFATRATVPAWVMLGYWFAMQVIGANVSALQAEGGGVAFTAHASGFVAGALLVLLFRSRGRLARRESLLSPEGD